MSGDGVEQDDYVSLMATESFQPPASLRVDNSFIVDAKGARVRLPVFEAAEESRVPAVALISATATALKGE